MFVDEVSVKLIAGKGGDGCTAFRREKYIAMGGPNGGNGGKGADIIFVADESLRTLIDLKMQKIIKGSKGNNGKGSDRNGANAENVYIKVPEGTVVSNKETGEIICDLVKNGQECIVAHGGRGGRGNKSFATHDNPAPKMSELGAPGEEVEIKCELKMLADVGLVGFPSVGKSTILSVISNATPKIAAYHFTTLSPNLGVVRVYDDTFVMADLPGLIEGASEGLGLGFQFLRHTSRCKVIAHVLDMSRESARNPIEDYEIIKNELKKYNEKILNKPSVIIANKMDADGASENLKEFKKKYPNELVIPISAATNQGLDKLMITLNDIIKNVPKEEESTEETFKSYTYEEEKPFEITKEGSIWVVKGKKVEELFQMTRFTEEESVLRFARILKKMGVEDKLESLGAQRGDEVKIMDYIFNFKE
ncbi:MAG: GTPase ObgE [Bacilli bacterium]|nr:GTPase ObgE [Bacilli bacterium]